MPAKWRHVRRYHFSFTGILFWLVAIWIGLILEELFNAAPFLGAIVGLLCALTLIVLGRMGLERAIPLLGRRNLAPRPVPPPPAQSTSPLCRYVREPKISYPILANARDQCGWVHLRLQVDPAGRIKRFMILDQAPGRTFESATVKALWRARIEPDPETRSLRDLKSLITFVLRGPMSPDWALERIAEPGIAEVNDDAPHQIENR